MVSEPNSTVFFLDANALLFLGDKYPKDSFPHVWETLSGLAATGIAVAPNEVLKELETRYDNGAYSWAKANICLFKTLTSAQIEIAREIVNLPGIPGLIGDAAPEIPGDGPFVAAMAISCHIPGTPLRLWPAVVSWSEAGTPNILWEACKVYSNRITARTPYELLRDLDLDVPPPSDRGLGELYGLWKDWDITDEDIASSKLTFEDRGL